MRARDQACSVLGLSARTLQRWQDGETVHGDRRPLRQYEPPHKLTAAERAAIRNWQRIQAVHLNPDRPETRADANQKKEKIDTQKAA